MNEEFQNYFPDQYRRKQEILIPTEEGTTVACNKNLKYLRNSNEFG